MAIALCLRFPSGPDRFHFSFSSSSSLKNKTPNEHGNASLFPPQALALKNLSDGSEAELSSYGKRGRVLGPVVGAYGEMSDDVYVIAEAVAEELATEHCGFYSDKKQGEVAAFFLSQIYPSWGLVAHRG